MGLKLEVGKYYRDANGEKKGPAWTDEKTGAYPWCVPSSAGNHWYGDDAKSCIGAEYDLIAEWTDAPTGPVRTVTRTTREIVPGVYGGIVVQVVEKRHVELRVDHTGGVTSAALRHTIATLTEIADALEDQ